MIAKESELSKTNNAKILKEVVDMTLKEFRETTKDIDENAEIIIDAVGNPVWYIVEKPRRSDDGQKYIYLMDKSGIDLEAEIEAALDAIGEDKTIQYLIKNGVTLDEMKSFSEELYESAKEQMRKL